MNTDYYRVIVKVAELGNITKAAEDLGYTQAGVSYIINQAESSLQVVLFQRSREGVKVLPEAKRKIPLMREIIELEDLLLRQADFDEEMCIKIATLPTVAHSWMPHLISDFKAKYPDYRVEIHEKGDYPYVVDDIEQAVVDLGFITDVSCRRLKFVPLYRDMYYVIFPENHPLEKEDTVSVDQLKGHVFIASDEVMHHQHLFDQMKDVNLVWCDLFRKTIDDYMTLQMVESGEGVSIIPGLYLYKNRYNVHSRKLKEGYFRLLGLGVDPTSMNRKVVKSFLDFTVKWVMKWQEKNDLFVY